MQTTSVIIATISIVISLASVLVAYSLFRLSMRQVSGDVIHRVIDRLEEPSMRKLRRSIYNIDRNQFSNWDESFQQDVDKWGAELDVIATLLTQEGDLKAFFFLYGDVILRSIYQIAPYGNSQRTQRGAQFWLPVERLGNRMLKIWEKSAKKGEYPRVIGVPSTSTISIAIETFVSDMHCQSFIRARK